jgi:hypothetical protein
MTENTLLQKAYAYADEVWEELPTGFEVSVPAFKQFLFEAYMAGALEMKTRLQDERRLEEASNVLKMR